MNFTLRTVSCFLLLTVSFCLSAQISSGTINYTEHRSFDFGDWMDAARKKQLEAEMASGAFDQTGQISFNEEEFSYQQLPVDASKLTGRNRWMARMGENPEVYYVNVKDSTRTDRRRIMDQAFILEEAYTPPSWNIANMKVGMKELPLPTQLATAITADGDTLTAYFTESIPLSIGPKGYGGLPGAILYLKVQSDGSATEYTMSTMAPNAKGLNILKPDDAKVITRKAFDKHMTRAKQAQERRRRGWDRGRD
ncbi:GLPGLI family protein [Neolewinella antarctica]|uniref:GLPGLI family protein n=1 Tax=Neolewinella antarctica TaxID=442734 RepID=A0ABX0X7N2_9BACT|nr:GLPGLI family protein [Neolewinella antarctica]NJC24989.1 GLPGLI family protein [Neolewinella antarctica]